ncbi:hypothetical protein KJ785_02220, partial [Patescibacteria group bacterium]|nr:hypothetical protein [Patescibacteria group bacterium]
CVTYPKIIDVSPAMSGAEGNWLSILGKNFGEDEGKVEFAFDKDGDGKISTSTGEWGEAIEANIVDKAGCGDTWTDKIIVVEVPSDQLLAVNSETSIRVVRADNSVLWDSTTDDYGNKPGTNKGWFTKNDIKLPGLCSVKTIEGAIAALPGVAIEAIGTAFGPDTNPQKALLFDKFEVPYSSWLNDKIQSQVPDINLFGKTAVSVLVDNKKSNAIKFEIISEDNEKNYYPTIQKIDPDSTTPGSMITISGSGFGSSGNIFISTSTSIALECAQTINQAVLPAECIKLEFTGFPEQCGNTWSNNQIIAKIPEDILPDNYYLALRNNYGYYTKAVGVKGEEDKDPLQVNDDEPLPGICLISPATGLAPLLNNPISIYGVNFSDLKKDIAVFFWQNTSTTVVNDITTWLGTNDEVVPENSVQTVSVNKITTFIPYRESDGSSMQSGPIKVAVGSKISNGFKYTVKDCRQADAETIEFMEADEESGYQCCDAEGTPDVGKWKPNFYACIGESRSAGYVWRFTTGDIIAKPRVLEQCDWKNWSNSQSDGKYPSPTPSTLWPTGEKACVNAVMAVKFNVAIDHASINAENVKVFACGGGEEADCTVGVQIDPAELNFEMNGNTLEIRVIPPAPELNSNTWYRVELSNKIESAIKSQNVGELAPTQYTLEETRPCGEGTAYCFDFKTSDFDCQMTSAEIDPKTYTTHYLGKLFSPDGTPPNPFYYFVWGKSDQACIVISADQYKWDWDAPEDVLDIEFAPYKYNPNSTSRTSLTALKESPGVKVEAKANVFKQNNLEKYNIDALEEIGQLNGLKIASADDIVTVDDFSGEDFTEFDNFTIDLEYTLDEVATSSMSVKDSQKGKFWHIHRTLYSQENGNYFILADRIFEDGFRMRELVSNLWEESPLVIYDSDKNSEDNWLSGKIKIEKQGNSLLIYDLLNGNATESIYQIAMPAVVNDYGEKISFGALPAEDQVVNTLYGTINKFTIEKVNLGESIETEIIATNTTTIAISPPKILDYAPNCAEACVNSSIWAKFDQPMSVDSFSNNMKLYKCFDGEKCKLHPFQNIIDKSVSSDKYTFRSDLNPGILLEPKTWYVVKVFGGDT